MPLDVYAPPYKIKFHTDDFHPIYISKCSKYIRSFPLVISDIMILDSYPGDANWQSSNCP